ncbi:P-loop containing nucleoside triphosphate hydrolase protein, partial [Mrakia frigida]|uniref:ATP-dependent helicase n=1 Tax=Mrakia frigida TaxID=29902 RepID=UPI003FCC1776
VSAVTSDPSIPLQILAGPGSGKTRVLTSRIVHIIEHHGILPNEICAVTFTNKSATEMKVRLTASIDPERTSQLILGTFHATCARYLRRYASHIGLPNNFTVQDASDSQKLVKSILSSFSEQLESLEAKLDAKSCLDMIGKGKSMGKTPMSMEREAKVERNPVTLMVSRIYAEYESRMKATDALDFEDLLLRGAELFRQEPWVLKSIKHIFVDEFQDTNVTQYGLLKLFAKSSGCVTIVGDPDQSIYGWRSADIENLSHMAKDFPKTKVILLEDNFRSTGAILAASYAIISQDQTRHAKGLIPFHGSGSPVVLKRCATEETEASFLASEIKRLKICTGLEWSDFSVLLRYGALSRPIEQAFQRAGIPNRMAAGHKFFDRVEIKTVLGYLQLADNPNFSPAFARVVNVPKRGIGEKTLDNIISSAQAANVSPIKLSRRGKCTVKISTAARSSLDQFLKVVDKLKKLADEGKTVGELIEVLLKEVDFEKHWKDDKWEDRLENIMELVCFDSPRLVCSLPSSSILTFPPSSAWPFS